MKIKFFTGVVLVVHAFIFSTSGFADDITIDGVKYENFTWGKRTPAAVEIFHKSGVASIPLENLPPELQEKFGYDPQKSAQHQAAEARAIEEMRRRKQAEVARLGVEWDSAEGDNIQVHAWRGPWVRRGMSNIFDCYQQSGGTPSFVATVTIRGDEVIAYRDDINDQGQKVPYTYKGRLMPDGSIVGTISRDGWQGQWEAKIKHGHSVPTANPSQMQTETRDSRQLQIQSLRAEISLLDKEIRTLERENRQKGEQAQRQAAATGGKRVIVLRNELVAPKQRLKELKQEQLEALERGD